MLKTRVALGNISRVLLNLIKRLMFVMFKDTSHAMFMQLTFIFSFYLVHQLRMLYALNFVPLPYMFG